VLLWGASTPFKSWALCNAAFCFSTPCLHKEQSFIIFIYLPVRSTFCYFIFHSGTCQILQIPGHNPLHLFHRPSGSYPAYIEARMDWRLYTLTACVHIAQSPSTDIVQICSLTNSICESVISLTLTNSTIRRVAPSLSLWLAVCVCVTFFCHLWGSSFSYT
jgi:hypothetical protein